jgi:hypothetical protein
MLQTSRLMVAPYRDALSRFERNTHQLTWLLFLELSSLPEADSGLSA